jgi:hypothetical protein
MTPVGRLARFARSAVLAIPALCSSGMPAWSDGVATHLSVAAPGTATPGTAFSIEVTALDSVNDTAPSYSGTVHFTSTDGTAVLPADSTLTNGVGVFSVTLHSAGSQTITATDTVNPSITGTSSSILVGATPPATPAPPTLLLAVLGVACVGAYLARRRFIGA